MENFKLELTASERVATTENPEYTDKFIKQRTEDELTYLDYRAIAPKTVFINYATKITGLSPLIHEE